jgi:hypothetical protein
MPVIAPAGGQGLCSHLFASEQTTKEHSQRVEALHTIVLQFQRNCATIAALCRPVEMFVFWRTNSVQRAAVPL